MMITYLGFFEEKKECYENEDTQDVNDNEKATEATATTTTSTTATTAGNCIDSSFVENITSIPSKVQSIIEPAIQALIDSVKNGNDDEDNIEDQDLFRPQKYIDEKDEYVGKVEEKENTDVMGNTVVEDEFVLDESSFQKMKTEYIGIDKMLKALKKTRLDMYEQIIQ
jgi:hypothetical protein